MSKNKPTICPCPAPKKLLTNWTSRNDSSKVNAILHPENYVQSGKRSTSKPKGKIEAKPILIGNNCYCRCKSKIPKPTVLKRPNKCVSHQKSTSNNKVPEAEDGLKRRSLRCICRPEDDIESSSGSIRVETVSSSRGNDVALQKTAQRKKYDQYRKEQEQIFKEKLQDDELEERYRRQLLGGGDAATIMTLLDSQDPGSTTSLSNDGLLKKPSKKPSKPSETQFSDIPTDEFPQFSESEWSIPDFRREHYFETHDVGKIGNITGDSSIDSHTCVHQFRLDKKWLPVAVNQDAFGRSLCKLCDKPMDGSCTNSVKSRSMFSRSSISKAELRSYANAYKEGFAPTTVNLGRGKSKIEVLLDDTEVSQLSSYINKAKRSPYYANSLALRHQKMSLV